MKLYHQYFLSNKYTKWYFVLIERSLNRKPEPGIRYERHHIIPKFLKLNIPERVRLTIREHFICHLLLTRMLTGLNRSSAFYSLKAFTMSANGSRRAIQSRAVELYRRAYENPEWKAMMSAKISAGRRTPESNAKIKAASAKMWEDPDYRLKISKSQLARWADPEESKIIRNKISSEENRSKISLNTKEAMQHPKIKEKHQQRHKETQENRTAGIVSAWADPLKKAARLEKLRATVAKTTTAERRAKKLLERS